MYKVRINKQTLRDHLQYDWWKYLLSIVMTIMLWNLGTTMTRPVVPDSEKVDIYLMGEYYLEEKVVPIAQELLEDFPELVEINFYPVSFAANPNSQSIAMQKLTVLLGSQSGDLYIFDKEIYERVAKQGGFIPLEPYINEEIKSLISSEKWDEVRVKIDNKNPEHKNELIQEPHIYGIPLQGVKLFEKTGFDVEDKVIGVMIYSKNQEKAIEVMERIIKEGR